VNVIDDPVVAIAVTPPNATLPLGGKQQFDAMGKTASGNQVPVTVDWGGTGGKFDDFKSSSMHASFARTGMQQATYTAGNLPGLYQVTATSGKVTGSAQVRITGPVPPDLPSGQSWNLTFFTAGTYPYYDRYNLDHRGTVVVNPVTANSEHNEGRDGNSLLAPFAAVTVPVTITAAGFDPPTVTINVSDTVCWTNADTTVHAIRGGVPFKLFLPLVVKSY
jgi:plastocyanin